MSQTVQQIRHNFLGKPPVKNESTQEYEGLNVENRVDTTNAADVYTDIQSQSIQNTGR